MTDEDVVRHGGLCGGGGDAGAVLWKKDVGIEVDMDDKDKQSKSCPRHKHYRHRTPASASNKNKAGAAATVEVTVKVKKRRSSTNREHRDRDHPHIVMEKGGQKKKVENHFPKGSWGDLLARNTNKELLPGEREKILSREISSKRLKELALAKMDKEHLVSCKEGGGDHAKCVCHKIPITSDLYLETHAHIKSKSKEKEMGSPTPTFDLLDYEPKKDVPLPQRQRKPSSGGSSESLGLRVENEALRSEAAGLLEQMRKAKQEQLEAIKTIRELYQLAEMLKGENQKLIGVQEERQVLQTKLVDAVSQNEELKRYLNDLMKQPQQMQLPPPVMEPVKDPHTVFQLRKMRDVIEEVKSTIQAELKEVTSPRTGRSSDSEPPYAQREHNRGRPAANDQRSEVLSEANAEEIRRILCSYEEAVNNAATGQNQGAGVSIGGAEFSDDTNASEIQRILGTYAQGEGTAGGGGEESILSRFLNSFEGSSGYLSPPPPARFK